MHMLNQAQHLNLDSVSTHRVSLALSAVLSLGNTAAPAHQSNAIPFPEEKGGTQEWAEWLQPFLKHWVLVGRSHPGARAHPVPAWLAPGLAVSR